MRILLLCLLLAPLPSVAALNIFACTPEWGSLAKELGGDKANVYTATTALQDPHKIEARPSLIARARNADLVVCTGAELEIGWLPLVQAQSGNPKIQSGKPGYFEAATFATLIEKPQRVDRSMGDVHPAGNPHIHLDPGNIAKVAAALGERMGAIDSPERAYYAERTKSFLERWRDATARWEKEGAPLKGFPLVVYHRDLSYLISWLGMREAGSLEPKPGLPPSTAHLSELVAQLSRDPAKAVARSAYNDPRAAEWIAERAKIRVVLLPYTVGGTERAKDLFGLYDDTLARLLEALR
ncbi:MAG TPA: zinc ABC transporter substrate-binding protein [Burkholderiales bacterium]|jgi:zinc/manganese transport system substrate-binding protein|nr:zinc ABC transporter substrate-binding protein [Burkholderiales bacterium]